MQSRKESNMLIRGLNPMVISSIRFHKGMYMKFGYHHYFWHLLKKKHPRTYRWWDKGDFDQHIWCKPSVTIRGADGGILKEIRCKSNEQAEELHSELTAQLKEFLNATVNT